MDLFDIKRYFGRRSDDEMSREDSLQLRGDNPGTTAFNRKLVMGLVGLFAMIFAFSMFFGMSKPGPDKQKEEATLKDKKIVSVAQTNSQLDKLPSSYEGKNQNINAPSSSTGGSSLPRSSIQDNYSPPRQPQVSYNPPRYQPVDYSSPPPIPGQQQGVLQQRSDSSAPALGATSTVDPLVSKEEQELGEARKSPIRFNLK